MYDVIIIGSGSAGYTAAIYACRAGRKTLILAGSIPGGQLMITSDVENFPGFPEGVLGPELMEKLRRQAEKFGPEIVYDDVSFVDFSSRPFKVSAGGKSYEGKSMIIATGANAKWLGLPSETKFRGKGVSSCATCDGFFFKGKDVVTVGGGDTAMEGATFLGNITNSVTVVHRRDVLRASKIMQERATANPKIHFVWDSTVKEITGDDKVTGVQIHNLKSGKDSHVNAEGVFVAIGYEPNTGFLKDKVELDSQGYVVTRKDTETSVPGVFAAGDVGGHQDPPTRPAAPAGCQAASDVDRFLAEHHKN